MSNLTKTERAELAQTFAFLGNSLLAPMTRTEKAGLIPEFWNDFPTFGDDFVKKAVQACAEYAESALPEETTEETYEIKIDALTHKVAQEYTALFIGPAQIKAIPWQTYYDNPEAVSGFGQVTFDMISRLREIGLAIGGENNQYADHLGIELLLLSEYIKRDDEFESGKSIVEYIRKYPGSWIAQFRIAIVQAEPEGYFAGLVGVIEALLNYTVKSMESF